MTSLTSPSSRRIVEGTVRGFLAEAVVLPAAIVMAAVLARRLGAAAYGLFTVAATIVVWLEWVIAPIFSSATVKFVRESDDWRGVGTVALRLHLAAGSVGALVVWSFAIPAATTLNEPELALYLGLFALDIPLFVLAHAHRSILIGTGAFNARALATTARSLSRLFLVVLLVETGFSVPGAIVGCIGGSAVEIMIIRLYVRPSLLGRSDFPLSRFRAYAGPLFLSTLSVGVFDRLDLFMLKWLGGTSELAGIYGAAQTLAAAPALFSVAFAPLLLSTETELLHTGRSDAARELGRESMRAAIWLLPFAAITAGAAPEIAAWIYGEDFLSAASPFRLLIFAQSALVMLSVIKVSLIAAGKPGWTSALTGPMVPLAITGHLVLIPLMGALGASLVTTAVTGLGVLAAMVAAYRLLGFLPPFGTLVRSILLSGFAYFVAASWPVTGALLLVKLPAIGLGVVLLFFFLGEFTARDLELVRELLRRPRAGEEISRGV
jgi:O-antigen/teichoic acid export membrane protein